MFSFIFGVIIGCAGTLFCKNITNICKAYEGFTALSKENPIKNMLVFALNYCFTFLEQLIRRSVIREGNLYRVKYIINGRLYEILVKPVIGPKYLKFTPRERGRISILLPQDTS